MSEEFKDFAPTPTLTLDPFQTPPEPELPVERQEKPVFDENVLTAEERKMAEQFADQIDLTNSQTILQYGAGTQKKMADFSESALANVRTKDMGEVGDLLSGVVKELKSFGEEEEEKGRRGGGGRRREEEGGGGGGGAYAQERATNCVAHCVPALVTMVRDLKGP